MNASAGSGEDAAARNDPIELAQAISAIRRELEEARRISENHRVQFAVGSVDLEFTVVASRELGGEAKVRFWVVDASAGGKLNSSSTQVVKIHLEPMDTVTKTQVLVAETEGSQSGKRSSAAVG
jgi:hypothetical protein